MADTLKLSDALIVVDLQNDFCPGGALPVPQGDQVVGVLNRWIRAAERVGAVIVISRDWHPPNHCSFETEGGPWPVHCVQNTPGAEYHGDLHLPLCALYVDKARDPDRESYSGFSGTGLSQALRRSGVQRIFIGGLALDYCVKTTALEGLAEGFEVHLILPATRAVNVNPGDGTKALNEMRSAGAMIQEDDP